MRHAWLEIHASDPHSCLARAKAQILDGADTENTPALVGTCVHRVAEAVSRERTENPMTDVAATVRSVVREQAKTLRMPPGAILDAVAILERCLADDSRVSLWPRMGWNGAPEMRWGLRIHRDDFEYVENPTEPCDAAGTIDLAEWKPRTVAATDYKTTLQMWSGQDAFDSFQIRLYLLALLRKVPDAQSGEGRFALLRHGYYATADFQRGDSWEAQTIAQLHAEREARAAAQQTGEFPETPGVDCHWCPLLLRCETATRYATLGQQAAGLLSPEEAARAWLAAKAVAARLEGFVRKHVEQSGLPIALDDPQGTVLGFHEVNGVEVLESYDTVMDRLRDFGMTDAIHAEHFRFVAPNHYASRVRKVLREVLDVNPETVDQIVVPVTRSEFTTFVPSLPVPQDATDELVEDALDRAFAVDPDRVRRAAEALFKTPK